MRASAELILQAAIYDRLDVLNEPIQLALDHYELANTRLIDTKTRCRRPTRGFMADHAHL